ncbi:MAG: winged helix-turn-helix transcriptional regulator [Candidatus Nanohaloarchaea archaeon]|nr:winged helix-turn-helix transcriptional regulator [Candidatus Nanohaloarchaea archaeon]
MADHECSKCGKSFDTSRGLNVHKSRVHGSTEKKREQVVLLEMIDNGKQSVQELVDSVDWSESRVRERLDDLVDEDYIRKNVESSKKTIYEITEPGREHIPKLVDEVVEETRDWVEGVRGSVEKHVGALLPEVEVTWPKDKEEKGDE